jgi:hypothetical protein
MQGYIGRSFFLGLEDLRSEYLVSNFNSQDAYTAYFSGAGNQTVESSASIQEGGFRRS